MALNAPSHEALRELAGWTPPHGVLSVYVDIDPADRGEGWRIELRNGLEEALRSAREGSDREARAALESLAPTIRDRFPPEAPVGDGRARIGFVEVTPRGGRALWYSMQSPPRSTTVAWHPRPVLLPLMALLDEGAPRGIALVSAERVRLLRWELGHTDEIDGWGLETFALDWRERKAEVPRDPARVQGVTSSGRDQFDQRLEANRERFLAEVGRRAGERIRAAGAQELLVVGDPERAEAVAASATSAIPVRRADGHNLVSAPDGVIQERVRELVMESNRDRERELVRRALGEAHGATRGALGPQETLQSLKEGRVEHLLFDSGRDYGPVEEALELPREDLPLTERMIHLALATSAAITPLEGEPAQALAEADGIAALLRY